MYKRFAYLIWKLDSCNGFHLNHIIFRNLSDFLGNLKFTPSLADVSFSITTLLLDTDFWTIETLLSNTFFRSSRKAWLKITIFAIHSPILLPTFLWGKRKGKRITKVVILSHACLLDHFLSWTFVNIYYTIFRKLIR